MSQLEQQGLLSGEALGQIFISVSDMLNTDASQNHKEARMEVKHVVNVETVAIYCCDICCIVGKCSAP